MGALSAIGGFFGKLASGAVSVLTGSGGQSAIAAAVDVVGKHVEDVDKRDALIADVIKSQLAADATATVPWVDSVIKLSDHAFWFYVIVQYMIAVQAGHPFDIKTIAEMIAGPSVFTFIRARNG